MLQTLWGCRDALLISFALSLRLSLSENALTRELQPSSSVALCCCRCCCCVTPYASSFHSVYRRISHQQHTPPARSCPTAHSCVSRCVAAKHACVHFIFGIETCIYRRRGEKSRRACVCVYCIVASVCVCARMHEEGRKGGRVNGESACVYTTVGGLSVCSIFDGAWCTALSRNIVL